MNAYLIGPDIGDCIAALAVVRHLGKGLIRLHDTPGTKGFGKERYEFIRPLIAMQPYCENVQKFDEKEDIKFTHDFTGFRNNWKDGRLLSDKLAVCVGVKPSDVDIETPWLTIPEYHRHGKIVVVRSSRNQGSLAYHKLAIHKAKECLFLGLPEEHEQLNWNCARNPGSVDKAREFVHQPARDAVEAAQVVMGARLFVGNPTAITWIAAGCGHPNMIIECSQEDTEFHRKGIRNVKTVADNPKDSEWRTL